MNYYRITENGIPVDESLYSIDYEKKVFTSYENTLVLDFKEFDGWTFEVYGINCYLKTGSNCTFTASEGCIFNTGSDCTFIVENRCTFKTGSNCTFKTGSRCTFKTGSNCTFKTANRCAFKTTNDCKFKTSSNCSFKTSNNCTFKTGSNCNFLTGCKCTFSLLDINSCYFKYYDGNSTIVDRNDKKYYLLTKNFVNLQNIVNG